MFFIILMLLLLSKSNCQNKEEKPTIEDLFTSTNLIEGKKYSVFCQASKESVNFGWLLNGRKVILNDNIVIDNHEDNSQLIIKSMNLENAGDYTCQIKNSNDILQDSRTVSVKLNVKPRFIIAPTNIFAKLNSLLNTKCQVTAIPLAKIKWIKLSANG